MSFSRKCRMLEMLTVIHGRGIPPRYVAGQYGLGSRLTLIFSVTSPVRGQAAQCQASRSGSSSSSRMDFAASAVQASWSDPRRRFRLSQISSASMMVKATSTVGT